MRFEGKVRFGCGKIISTEDKFKISAQHVVVINHNNWYKLSKMKVVKYNSNLEENMKLVL